ncbi:MAG: DUF2905 domain-containing protein [Anaerolineales bacterium]|nr:DUF2905 domain-containing protein [Anaerolineales bacterium]
MYPLARIFIILGLVMIMIGGLLYLFGRVGLPLGRLPGDIRIQGENVTCFLSLATMIVVSVVLTVLLNIIVRLLNR